MAKCKFCLKGGFFQSVDNNGLCDKCAYPVISDIQQRARISEDCIKLTEEGKTFGTRTSRHQLLIEHLDHLLVYELKGIPTISPRPSELLNKFGKYRGQIVSEEINAIADKAKKQAELTASVASKFNVLAKSLLKVQEILDSEGEIENNNETAIELRSLMHKAKIEGYTTEARKAEFKGNAKKALDQYQEALFYIENDEIDDELQSEEKMGIKLKISELSDAKSL